MRAVKKRHLTFLPPPESLGINRQLTLDGADLRLSCPYSDPNQCPQERKNLLNMFKTKPFWIYGLIFLAWAAVSIVTTGLVFKLALHEAEVDFEQRVVQLHESIDLIARDNEAILEGFSAFLSAIQDADRESASRYARQILARYPHVNALEVALIVKRNDLAEFITSQKQSWFPQFKVKAFSYAADRRTWQAVKKKQIYSPVIFIEPMSPNTKQQIGADMDSTTFLRDALNQSEKLQSSVATIPFNFAEGSRGYILFHPVPDPPKGDHSKRKQAVALLEVNVEAIRKKIAFLMDNIEFRLYHANYSSDEPEGMLLHIAAFTPPTRLEARLFPKLTSERKLNSRGQPFALKVDKQLGWSDLDLPFVVATGSTLLLLLALLLLFLNIYFRKEEQRKRSAYRLLHMATHDALTGLPNRTLLADRFTQACSRTQRRDMTFSTMFLDLNEFKKVNDTYGHEVGDQLLKTLGSLLKECIRNEDTLSRISGDEFVILLENTSYENAEGVAQKIQAKLAQPVLIQGIELNVSISIGIAVYPDDGMEMSELLSKADTRMYKAKEQSKTVLEELT
jgi:diguanylate cyclase (GGDEF)-like protein